MKPKFRSLAAAFSPATRGTLVICASLCATASVHAASQTWDGDTDATWATAANWVAGAVPGIVYTANNTNTTDIATFNGAITANGGSSSPVVTETNRMIGRILFDTANAGSYVIGAASTPPTLTFGNNLTNLDVTAAVVNPQTINSPVALHLPSSTNGFGSIQSNSTTTSATLNLVGGILNSPNSSRGTVWTLGGTNTGENTISGPVTITNTGGQNSKLIKTGVGTWVLSGANNFAPAGGVQIDGGILAVANNTALGTHATANNIAVAINNTGTLEVRNGLTMDNGISLNLNNGGTIKAVGTTGTNGRVNVGTAAATSVFITTNSSGDVFTIGNGTNDLTGGATDSVINLNGPGTVIQNVASNYAGKWLLNSGALRLGSATALGAAATAGVSFGASSTAVLETFGQSPTITTLNSNATPGTPVIRNGDASLSSILTVNNTTTDTYAGSITDGSTGTLGLTKGGSGSLTLSGTNTYTGGTVVNSGTLKINTASSTPTVSVNSGATLGGSGSVSGDVMINNLGHLAPGNSVGTLTAGSLTVETGAVLDYEFGTGNDLAVVSNSDGLTLNGGGVNLYQEGTTNQFNTVGTYNLIQYSGTIGGAVSNLSVLNPDPFKNYAFSADGSNVKLAITLAPISLWNLASGGDWASGGSWTGAGVPNASGTTAIFGSALASPGTVTLNGGKTVATVAFDNSNSYTIAPASSETLTLDNTVNSGQAQITGTNGSHQISAPVVLNSNTVVSVANSADTITLSGSVSGSGNLTKSGPGSLVLSVANTFSGNVTVSGGNLTFSTGSLGAGFQLSMGASSLVWATGNTDDVSDAGNRTVEFLPGTSTWNTNGNDVTIAGSIGNFGTGSLVKAGSGNLTLSGLNTYTGNTTVNGGTLTINSDASLGATPGSPTPGSLTINSATVGLSGIFTVSANRGVALNSATSGIHAESGANGTFNGIVAGTGVLNVTGPGIVGLGATNTYGGGTVINTGATLNLSGTGTPGTGQVALSGGTLTLNRNLYTEDNILIDAAQTGTIDGLNDRVGVRGLTGSGTVTLITRFGGTNVTSGALGFRLQGNHSGFTGTVNLKSGTGTVNSFAAFFNGSDFDGSFGNATINMTDFARLGGVNNSGGNTMTIGALSGDSSTILSGADYAGSQTYNIGGLNTNTTFAGIINNGNAGRTNIIKSGTGSFTLTGLNTYTGNTTVNDGTLVLADNARMGFALGATSGANNALTGAGAVTLDGDFTIDVTAASALTSGTWLLEDLASVSGAYGATFSVMNPDGSLWTDAGNDLWTKVDGPKTWTFDETTGTLTLASAGFSGWATTHAGGGTASGDFDNDGVSNGLEWVLGGDELTNDLAKLPTVATTGGNLIINFVRDQQSISADTTLQIEVGTTLAAWPEVYAVPDTAGTSGSPGTVTVTKDSPVAGKDTISLSTPQAPDAKKFARLKVTIATP